MRRSRSASIFSARASIRSEPPVSIVHITPRASEADIDSAACSIRASNCSPNRSCSQIPRPRVRPTYSWASLRSPSTSRALRRLPVMISTVAPSASKAMSVASPATPATAGTSWRVPHSSWRRRWASASLTGIGWRSMFSSPSWKKISAGTWSRLRSQIPPLSTSTL